VRHFYPPIKAKARTLRPFQSTPLSLSAGQQVVFTFTPDATRRYTFATFGEADTHLAIRSEAGGQPDVIAEDDDSGTDRNARVTVRLEAGRPVRVQVRMRYIATPGNAAVMAW
jgi:hypothetical protein